MSFIQLPSSATANLVRFPGLGLEFHLNRVAIQLFNRPIYWYGIVIGIGFLLAVLWCAHRAPRYGIRSDNIYDLVIAEVPLCLIGSRVYYVLFYLDHYRKADGSLDWAAIFRISDGGIAIYGTIIVAMLVLVVFCRWKKISFLTCADLGVQGLLIGQIIGRWGNFINVEAFGSLTKLPWRMSSASIAEYLQREQLLDSTAQHQAILDGSLGVHPTFLYESLWNLVGLILICIIAKKAYKFDGQLFFSYLFWYGVGRCWIEGLRTDSLYFFGLKLFGMPIRVSQVVAFVSACVGGGVLIYQLWFRRGKHRPLYAERVKESEEPKEKEAEE